MKNLITCLSVTLLSGSAFATTWTVDDDGKADFENIQDAIDAASDGDEIIVMPGTYIGTDNNVVEMPSVSVTLRSSDPSDWEVVVSTIIDGENKRRGLFCNADVSPTTIINGLTFANGRGNNDGGGMLLDSSITVKNCRFENNIATYAGGGLRISYASASIEDCEFHNNSAYFGGGVSVAVEGNPIFTRCNFIGNFSNEGGCGGAVSSWASYAEFYECNFYNNTSECGGAIFMATDGAEYWPLVSDSAFCGNLTEDFSSENWTDGGGNIFFEECDDCNNNDVLDWQDIIDGTSFDCDENGIPDECQTWVDCNKNGIADYCDIAAGISPDCDRDGIPDECQSNLHEFAHLACGVNEVGIDGTPGPLYPESNTWTPIVAGDSDVPLPSIVMMASEFGFGRIIATAGILGSQTELYDNWIFNSNTLSYLTLNTKNVIGYSTGHNEYQQSIDELAKVAKTLNIVMEPIPSPITAEYLADYSSLFVAYATGTVTEDEIDVIEQWVNNGGKLVMLGLGWVWDHYHKGTMEDYPMNQLGSRFGVRWLKTYNTNLFHTFYPEIYPASAQQSVDRIVQLHKTHGDELPIAIETNDATRLSFLQAHATLAIPTREFPSDHPDREFVYDATKSFFEQWPDYYARGFSFDEQTVPLSAWVRERAWLTWRDSLELNAERKEQISDLGQLVGIRHSLFMQYDMLLLENDHFGVPEIQFVHDLCALTPTGLLSLNSMSAVDCLGDSPSTFNLRGAGSGVNVFCMEIGQVSGNPFPEDITPYECDGFIAVASHEANHVVDGIASADDQWNKRKNQLIVDAGEDSMNYLRSMIPDGYFVNSPQEFFASIANQWFAKSAFVLELGLIRFEAGRPDPINQALFFADTYSQGSNITWFYTSDETGLLTRDPVLLIRDSKNRIIGLDYSGMRYDFSLDTDGRVVGYTTFGSITGACCINNTCIQVHQDSCLLVGGDYLGHNIPCANEDCLISCEGDITQDELVNVLDLLTVIDQWGLTNSPADVNEDGIVNVSDLLMVVGNWGSCE
ncbi:MAG: hypothetical protein HOC79_08335 [Euryarchaeota archaeon]|nr:hypothetical protein [Euryarchaeota archaeon]